MYYLTPECGRPSINVFHLFFVLTVVNIWTCARMFTHGLTWLPVYIWTRRRTTCLTLEVTERVPASACLLNIIFYCSVGEHSWALVLINAALYYVCTYLSYTYMYTTVDLLVQCTCVTPVLCGDLHLYYHIFQPTCTCTCVTHVLLLTFLYLC